MEDQNAEEKSSQPSTAQESEPAVETSPLADGAAEIAPQLAAANADEESSSASEAGAVEDASDASVETADAPEAGEAAPEGADDAEPEDELGQLAARAQQGRLSMPDEERAKALLKETLIEGKAKIARAAALLPRFAWVVGVDAVTAAWADMKATARTQLLKALADEDSDQVRRMRLSLARGLFKSDVPAALKIAVSVAKELKDKDTGAIPPKRAQIFSNVFIGKAKPWVAQLPLGEMKPADADLLVHTAVFSAFSLPHPPVTQLGVLKWAAEAGRLARLQEIALEPAMKAVSRWSGKWQAALRKEVAELPEPIIAALHAPGAESPEGEAKAENGGATDAPSEAADRDAFPEAGAEGEAMPDRPKKERPVYEPRPQRPVQTTEPPRERDSQRKERPVYEPRNSGGGGGQGFNLQETLRQIESHVQALRSELSTAQAKLRQRDDDGRRGRRGNDRPSPVVEGEPTVEELARLNQQLESRIGELQVRITELTSDSEDRAVSTGAMAGEPVEDTGSQLRTLLALKLQEDYADFLALEQEAPDFVVQQHYKALLKDVFQVLLQEGVALDKAAGA